MRRIENRCVGCAVPGYPCMGASCPNRNAEILYCDRCGAEVDEISEVDGEELCEACAEEKEEAHESDIDILFT